MEREIAEIINEYKDKKQIGISFFNRIIDIYLKEKNLYGLVDNKVKINTSDDFGILAGYIPSENNITVFTKVINKYIRLIEDCCKDIIPNEDMKTMLLYNFSQIMLHELEHVNQEKIIRDNNKNNIESELLIACNYSAIDTIDKFEQMAYNGQITVEEIEKIIESNIKKYGKLAEGKYHDLFIRERLSQIKSFKTLRKVYEIQNIHPNFLNYINKGIVSNQLKGYEENDFMSDGPTLKFIDVLITENLKDKNCTEYYDEDRTKIISKVLYDLSLEERIDYGLPITLDEYQEKKQESKVKYLKK